MTKIQKYCCSAIGLLAVLCISTFASHAQRTTESGSTDPFAVLPPSDALIVLEVSRFTSEVIPQLLVGEQDRALVMALFDSKAIDLLDPRAIQQLVIGLRYSNPPDEKSASDFEVVTVARSSEAGQLASIIRTRGSGKYLEQQYAGRLLYITKPQQTELKEATTITSSDEGEWAIVALDANTFVFGIPAYVRSSIDVNSGKGTTVNAELVAAVRKDSKALLRATGTFPASLIPAVQPLANSELSQILSSLTRVYASVEVVPTGLRVTFTLNTASPEQAKTLVDLLTAVKTLAGSFAPGKTKYDKTVRDLVKGLVISPVGTEVQISEEITQASINELAKHSAAGMYFSLGLAHEQTGNSDAAIAAYDKSIILDPDNANTFINRGKARSSKGTLDAAIADYDKAISMDPESALAFNNRCFTQLKNEDFEAAIADCDKAIALAPGFAFSYNNRGQAYASLGKLEKAIPDFDKSIALDKENIFAYQNRGDARIQIGYWDGAIADFDKAITNNPKSAVAYNSRGLARYYQGDFDQAIADFNNALSLDPNLAITYNNRALALTGKGNPDKAMADYDKSIALEDKNDVVYTNRGYLRNQRGDSKGAIADFDKAIALNSKSADAYNGRGLTRYSKEESDQAIADFDKAIAIIPTAIFHLNRGYARSQKSDYDGAISDFDKSISLNPNVADAYNARGLSHYYKLNLDQSIADYDKAITLEPNLAEAYGNRAMSLLSIRKDAQAEQDLKKCFALNETLRPLYEPLAKELKKTRPSKP